MAPAAGFEPATKWLTATSLPLSYAGALYEDRIYNLSFKCQAKIYKKIKKYGAEMLIVTSQSKRTG